MPKQATGERTRRFGRGHEETLDLSSSGPCSGIMSYDWKALS